MRRLICLNWGVLSILRKSTGDRSYASHLYLLVFFYRMPDPDFTVNDVKMCVGKY